VGRGPPGGLAGPADETAAKAVIAQQKPTPELTETRASKTAESMGRVLSWLLDPDTMPAPATAPSCAAPTTTPKPSKKGEFDDFIDK
jgi:hypothetical protein